MTEDDWTASAFGFLIGRKLAQWREQEDIPPPRPSDVKIIIRDMLGAEAEASKDA